MPYRVIAFSWKKSSMPTADFIDYYENKHIPMIIALSGPTLPYIYKRRYTHKDASAVPTSENPSQYGLFVQHKESTASDQPDVVVELVWEKREDSVLWMKTANSNGGGERIWADEDVFLERERTIAFVVEEYETRKDGE